MKRSERYILLLMDLGEYSEAKAAQIYVQEIKHCKSDRERDIKCYELIEARKKEIYGEIQKGENMKKTNSKIIKKAYVTYQKYGKSQIYGLYKTISPAKLDAVDYCEELCKKYNGEDLRYFSATCWTFAAGFVFKENGKKCFCWITRDYDRYTEIE